MAKQENGMVMDWQIPEVLPNQRHAVHRQQHNMLANRLRAIIAAADRGMKGDAADIERARRYLNIVNQHMQIHTEQEQQQREAMMRQMQEAQGGGGYENMGEEGGTLAGQPPVASEGQIEGGALGGETGGAVL
jgi:hypothetical protein